MSTTKSVKHKWPWILIFLYMILIGGSYLAKFHDYSFSEDPSKWGAMGDYFGGLINPLSSLMALYFLIKTYLAQKEELSETKQALKDSAKHQEATAKAQAELAILEAKSLEAAERRLITQALSTDMSSRHEEIRFLSSELERCATARGLNQRAYDINGNKLIYTSDFDGYREECFSKINTALIDIKKIRAELQKYYTLEGETK
ncbi:hypothetical protein K5D32_21065 [Pseudomonas cichorii]|uniref:hypothetical protein n=1 Tax=Pseudomonas cichorii TaxID=36746 RepID=UPI001C88E92A|nr:hypothetical protein [Pseudomonas cichorii]MBX8532165.1 hypothetical protein [Pseudomonas cichorii]